VSRWLAAQRDALDSLNKIALAAVAIAAPFIANSFEKRMTGTTLLSQREQAESQLRATMFSSLLSPVIGSREAGELDIDREVLLTELLALNFHEHFEFKPLLQHVYDRAKRADPSARAEDIRESLRSIARRVKDRQIASLFAEGRAADRPAQVWSIRLGQDMVDGVDSTSFIFRRGLGQQHLLEIESPDRSHTVFLWTGPPDWVEDTVRVFVRVMEGSEAQTSAEFVLTPFDFPLTDNTRLDDGNRFAVVVDNGSGERMAQKEFKLKFVWFPKGYSTPHERPLNFRDLQQLVGKPSG
jgi:hypothetical protein